MKGKSRFTVSLEELESVHVPVEEQVEERDVTPPVPEMKSEEERDRETILRVGVPGI